MGDFDDEIFVNIENVPVFAEHETTARDGRKLHFGLKELQAIANRCNRRIAETEDYAAICVGHTPGPEARERGVQSPPMIGAAGPFRIGKIGKDSGRQRYAILADFHIFKDDYDKFRKHPRRSVELWLEDTFDEMFLDPICCLGAEPPRLDLGMVYSRFHPDKLVAKYAAAAPSPTDVYVPSDESNRTRFQSGETMPHMENQELIQEIVDALMQTPQMQWVSARMGETSEPGEGGGEIANPDEAPQAPPMASETPEPEPAAAPPSGDMNGDAGPPPEMNGNGNGELPEAEPEEKEDFRKRMAYMAMDEMDDDELHQYMAKRYGAGAQQYQARSAGTYGQTANEAEGVGGVTRQMDDVPVKTGGSPPGNDKKPYQASGSMDGKDDGPATNATADAPDGPKGSGSSDEDGVNRDSEPYSRRGDVMRYQMELRQLSDTVGQLKASLEDEKAKRVNAERYQKLMELKYHGYSIDVEHESKKYAYGRYSDDQFKEFCDFIAERGQRCPVDEGLPYSPDAQMFDPSRPGGQAERSKYSREVADEAGKIASRKAMRGERVSYEEILEDVANGKTTANGAA